MSDSDRVDEDIQFARELNRQLEQSPSADADPGKGSNLSDSVAQRVHKAKPILDLLSQLRDQRSRSGDVVERNSWILQFKHLGRFEIKREIGRGGNGIVFLAFDERLNRHVALKVPHIDGALSGSTRQRFEREARATAILSHPSIVAIYEFGHDRGVYFIASQYIDGINLAHWMETNGRPNPLDSARIVAKLAEAIEHAHQRGVLHRDLKPSNILVEKNAHTDGGRLVEHCRIADFGLAAIEEDTEDLTISGAMVGTPACMSPEQTRASKSQLGPATDVYGLGVILYQLLVGRAPFVGEDLADIVEQVRKRDPDAPSISNPDVERDLDAICLKCLEKKPENRYATAFALQQDLQRFIDGDPVEARPVSGPTRLWRWMSRHPQTATMIGIIVGLMLALTIGSTIAAFSISRSRTRAVELLNRETAAKKRANESEAEAQRALFESSLSNAGALLLSGRQGQSRKSIASVTAAAKLKDRLDLQPQQYAQMRSLIAGAASLVDISSEHDYGVTDPLTSVVNDSQVQLYALANRSAGVIEIRTADDSSMKKKLIVNQPLHSQPLMLFSRDSRFLGASYKTSDATWNLSIWELARSANLPVIDLEVSWSGQCMFDFSADSQYVGCFGTDGKLAVLDLDSGDLLALSQADNYQVLKFANRGNQLAVANGERLDILEIRGNQLGVTASTTIPTRLIDLSWSLDDSLLAAGGNDKLAYLWRLPGLVLSRTFSGHGWQVIRVDIHPNNRMLTSYSRDRTTRIWNIETGEQLLQSDHIQLDRFDTSGDWIGTRTGKHRIWFDDFHQVIESKVRTSQKLIVHPDGRILAICRGGVLQLFDLDTGSALLDQNISGAAACFTLDGQRIIIASQFGVYTAEIRTDRFNERMHLTIGPPEKLNDLSLGGQMTVDQSGRLAAISIRYPYTNGRRTAGRLDLQTGTWSALTPPPKLARWNDLTVDGKWMVVGPWHSRYVTVWDTATGKKIQSLDHSSSQVKFSKDMQLLAVDDGNAATLYRTSDWQPEFEPRVKANRFAPMPIAFSHNNRFIALLADRRTIEILELDSFTPVYSLSVGEDQFIETLEFTPNDRRLLAGSGKLIHVWNLPLLDKMFTEAGIGVDFGFGPPTSSENLQIDFLPGPLRDLSNEYEVSTVVNVVNAHLEILQQNEEQLADAEAFGRFVAAMNRIELSRVPADFRVLFDRLLQIWAQHAAFLNTSDHLRSDLVGNPDEMEMETTMISERLSGFRAQSDELWSQCLQIQTDLKHGTINDSSSGS